MVQEDHHSSVVDARAAMAFFKLKEILLQNCVRETKPLSTLNPKKRPKTKRRTDDTPHPAYKMNEPFNNTNIE